MFKKIKKFKTIIILASIFVIVALLTLFIPILIFRKNEENNLKQTINLESLEIINYNPFKPKIRQYIKLDDPAYWVIDQEYQRTGLFSFVPADSSFKSFEEMDIIKVDGNNLEEAKANFKKQQSGKLTDQQKIMEERNLERDKPVECQRLLEFENKGTKIKDFTALKKQDEFSIYWNQRGIRGYMYETNNIHKFQIRIDDSQNDKIVKLVLITDESPEDNMNTQIQGIELITDSCQTIPVPTNPDGTFDFESALKEIE